MSRWRAIVALSRPRFWLYLGGPVLVGLVYGVDALGALVDPFAVAVFLYFLLPANVYLYGLNDVYDAEIDRFNPKKRDVEGRYTGDEAVLWAILASAFLGLIVLALVPPATRPWLLGFFLLGAAYSIPPIRLKGRPALDSISNGLYILPGVGAYVFVAGELPPVGIIVGAWLWTMGMHTFSAIPDIGPDRRAGVATTATVLGQRRTLGYCFGCWAVAALAFGLVDLRAGLVLALYPALVAGVAAVDVPVGRAYWWFPAINAGVGMVLTLYGLWVMADA